jgi:AcrR family transcriptional regulator
MNRGRRSRMERKSRILESASHVFAKSDYAEVSIDDVARGAGVARGTVYNYFGSKGGLYQVVFTERLGALMDGLEEVLERDPDPVANLRRCVVQPFLFFVKYPNLLMLWRRADLRRLANGGEEPERLTLRLLDVRGRLFDQLERVLGEGIAAGCFRAGEPAWTAQAIMGSIEGTAGSVAGKEIGSEPVRAAREALLVFVGSSLEIDRKGGGR